MNDASSKLDRELTHEGISADRIAVDPTRAVVAGLRAMILWTFNRSARSGWEFELLFCLSSKSALITRLGPLRVSKDSDLRREADIAGKLFVEIRRSPGNELLSIDAWALRLYDTVNPNPSWLGTISQSRRSIELFFNSFIVLRQLNIEPSRLSFSQGWFNKRSQQPTSKP